MSVFKCKMCGGSLEVSADQTTAVCEYCGTQQTLPKLGDDRRANLYDRANHFRRNNEFDKAMSIYENILSEDGTDAEAYWSLVLCRYGIEYVEDPATHKRVPTVNRAQFTSIFDDDNYQSALSYADVCQKAIYEAEAKAINEIQKGILAISQKEEPFDVFICYKETDNNGRRTPDSVLANDLYHQLTAEGFKVFFSRITLEDKLGTAYEPYIFAALNSAKVMVVLGTRPEYFKAVWVKNKWSRYLSLVKQSGGKKILIPAYKDMDPYDLPEEFSHLQAQDMSKLGFMQDLIRGIKKLAQTEAPTAVKETVVVNTAASANTAPLLRRVFMFLEDGDWDRADDFCEQVLNLEPECAEAYLGKLMVDLECCTEDELRSLEESFGENKNYKKLLRFGSDDLTKRIAAHLSFIEAFIEDENQRKLESMEKEEAEKQKALSEIRERLKPLQSMISGGSHTVGLRSDGTVVTTKYTGEQKWYRGQCDVSGWSDIVAISAGSGHTVGLRSDGTVIATNYTGFYLFNVGQCDVSDWSDVVAISAGSDHTVGLKADGTVVANKYTGKQENYHGQCKVSGWKLFNSLKNIEAERRQLREERRRYEEEQRRIEAEQERRQQAIAKKRAEIASLQAERSKLGIFAGKQKKEIDAKIAALEAEIRKM